MEEGPLVRRLEELVSRLEDVEERLAVLERGRLAASPPAEPRPEPATPATAAARAEEILEAPAEEIREATAVLATGTLPLIGRTVLVLGGGFLLRAITEAELIPQAAGSFVGLAYAVAWLVLADRVAARKRLGDATFHGVATALIAFPLLWESTLEFQILAPTVSAVALLATASAGIAVAWHRRLPVLAWVVLSGAIPTAVALGFASRTLAPFLVCLLLLGLATAWLAIRLGTVVLSAAVGLCIDVVFLFLAVVMLADPGAELLGHLSPWALLALQAGLVIVYWGSSLVNVLLHRHELDWAAVLQAVVTLFAAVGAGVAVALSAGVAAPTVAAVVVLLGAGCYAAAFAFVERHQGRGRTFHLYTATALVLVLTAVPLGLGRIPMAITLAAGGAAAVALGARASRGLLILHGSIYVLGALIGAGLPMRILDAFLGPAGSVPGWADVAIVAAVLGAAAAGAFPVPQHRYSGLLGGSARVASGLVSLLLVLAVAALVATLGATWLPTVPEGGVDPASLATLRTGVLAAAAVVLMGISYRPKWADLRAVGYSLVALGAVKLLLEDLRVGHAATLFVSLALYGGALLLMSRFLRGAKSEH